MGLAEDFVEADAIARVLDEIVQAYAKGIDRFRRGIGRSNEPRSRARHRSICRIEPLDPESLSYEPKGLPPLPAPAQHPVGPGFFHRLGHWIREAGYDP